MNEHLDHPCRCCAKPVCPSASVGGVDRRVFLAGMGAVAATTLGASAASNSKEPDHTLPQAKKLIVQPLLIHSIPKRQKERSWRSWGAIQTREDAAEEQDRIGRELAGMKKKADFGLEVRPLIAVQSAEEAARVAAKDHDVLIMYAAGGGTQTVEAASNPDKWTIMFVRHRSGPVYLWFEIAHNRYLRKTVDTFGQPGMGVRDVVVDSHDEILWRLRALGGLKNTLGKRMIAVGGMSGWGRGGQHAPDVTRKLWKMDCPEVTYDDLEIRIKKKRDNASMVKWCNNEAEKFLKEHNVSLDTSEEAVKNAFVLTEVFKDLMDEAGTDSMTVNSCMGTIMPISETSACLPLSLLNDQGYTAFCESDFVVIPSGVLLHHISGKPVFLNDPTYPHDGVVTLAHCTAPRKMDGEHNEPTKVLTHFESDYGAAPKVDMKIGQKITVLDPDFSSERWMGFEGEIVENPFYDICRSQIDVGFDCDTDKLNEETRGFHWMACYGDYLKETGYALEKVGVDWLNLT